MGLRLVGFAMLVVAALVLGIVLASGGGPEEGASDPAATVDAPPASPPTPPTPTTLRYDRQDTTGAATAAGSYAFLKTAGDATSAIENFEYGYSGVVELRIHPADASGTSRAAFYDTVQVGDTFDYRTDGLDCGFRFRVTGVAATATPRTFGIEYGRSFGGWCDNAVDDASGAKHVQFVWRVPAGVPGPDGVREMLPGEAVGPGTYRVFSGAPWVFDVPRGMKVIHYGPALGAIPAGAPPGTPSSGVMLIDTATDSRLGLDWKTGRETRRVIKSPELSALFDQIMASIRRVDGPASPPEPVTLRYDRLDITGAATAVGSYAFLTAAGDATSAIENFGHSASQGVELRIHPTDASDASRAPFYDTVQVGDSFDYRTHGLDCGFRFKVTRAAATTSPRTFGIEKVGAYGGWCGFVEDPVAARDVQFVWGVRPGIEGPDGVRVLLYGELVGEGTYRFEEGLPYVLNVPAGGAIMYGGSYDQVPDADDPNASTAGLKLIDVATDSVLHIDANTGQETRRIIKSPDADALFDQIMASLRRVE